MNTRHKLLLGIFSSVAVAMAIKSMNKKKLPRGVLNNNPGNIRKNNNFSWNGEVGADNKGFVKFLDSRYGFRAMAKILKTYRKKYGIKTIRGIVSRYAPPVENDTENYVEFVSKQTGIRPDHKMGDVEFLRAIPFIIFAMSIMEVGRGYYTFDDVVAGVKLS